MARNFLDGLFGPPKQTTTTRVQSEPWAPTQGLLGSLGSSIGAQFGGAPMGTSMYSAPAGKRLPPGTGTTSSFNIGLTGAETAALDAAAANTQNAGRYAPDIGLLAGDLFKGGTDRAGLVQNAYDTYRAGMLPYASMSTNPFDDPNFNKALGYIRSDALDAVKSSLAGAGYSPAGVGDFGAQVGEGITKASMPFVMQRQGELEGQKRGAIQGIFGAGTTTAGQLTSMDQNALGNRQAAIGVGQAALSAEDAASMRMLELEAKRRGIPLNNLTALASLIVPMAQLGGTKDSTSTTQTQVPIGQQLLGLGMTGAGLLSGMGGFGGGGLLAGLSGAGGLLGPAAGFANGGMAMVPTYQSSGQLSYVPRSG